VKRLFSILGAAALLCSVQTVAMAHEGEPNHDHADLTLTGDVPALQTVDNTWGTSDIPVLKVPLLSSKDLPWTSTALNNNPGNFQFAIVTDRTGSARPGIFESAMDKLNILQPEFVMSVGDLIQGYTKDEKLIDKEWDELQGLVARLQMPFFYVPGNHDMATKPEKQEWLRRFGANYYHFIYGDVLFLCLDSEDGEPVGLSDNQLKYFNKVLADNKDVRWTLVFLHRPLWLYTEAQSPSTTSTETASKPGAQNWAEFENLLKGRKHTIYAGHVHNYVKYVRNNSKYITLATTGGGSPLRGVDGYGEFDQVVWITMTDDGPIMANLMLDGIRDENLRTEEVARYATALLHGGVRAQVTVTDPTPFTSATVYVKVTNPAKLPLQMELQPIAGGIRFSPTSLTLELKPKESITRAFVVDGSQMSSEHDMDAAVLGWKGTLHPEGKPALDIAGKTALLFDPHRRITQATESTAVDGNFKEWDHLWSMPQQFRQVVGPKHALRGANDAVLQLAAQYDDELIYVAAHVTDDSVSLAKDEKHMNRADTLIFQIGRADEPTTSRVEVKLSPSRTSKDGILVSEPSGMSGVCRQVEGGYDAEIGVPVSAVFGEPDGKTLDWSKVRINISLSDRDDSNGTSGLLWWRPDWTQKQSYPGSGVFQK